MFQFFSVIVDLRYVKACLRVEKNCSEVEDMIGMIR